eukprot:1197822-Amphidinium_carterae.1
MTPTCDLCCCGHVTFNVLKKSSTKRLSTFVHNTWFATAFQARGCQEGYSATLTTYQCMYPQNRLSACSVPSTLQLLVSIHMLRHIIGRMSESWMAWAAIEQRPLYFFFLRAL